MSDYADINRDELDNSVPQNWGENLNRLLKLPSIEDIQRYSILRGSSIFAHRLSVFSSHI